MELPIDKLFELLKFEPGSGMIQSILLLLIWMNIRSLKRTLEKLEDNHDTRIGKLEVKDENKEVRLTVLETKNRGI